MQPRDQTDKRISSKTICSKQHLAMMTKGPVSDERERVVHQYSVKPKVKNAHQSKKEKVVQSTQMFHVRKKKQCGRVLPQPTQL